MAVAPPQVPYWQLSPAVPHGCPRFGAVVGHPAAGAGVHCQLAVGPHGPGQLEQSHSAPDGKGQSSPFGSQAPVAAGVVGHVPAGMAGHFGCIGTHVPGPSIVMQR